MVTYLEFLLVGFFALIKGADMFVDGASGLAKKFHVPGMIIGLTIVAMGTSAPELAVSVAAALRGSNEIAVRTPISPWAACLPLKRMETLTLFPCCRNLLHALALTSISCVSMVAES